MKTYEILAPTTAENAFILSPQAMEFLADMERFARARRHELLQARQARQRRFDQGERPDFLAETAAVRDGEWSVDNTPDDLKDRRVEITGPVDRKMIINALNSGAKVFMADFEDSNSPTWSNCLNGQLNLFDAVRRRISYVDPDSGKRYSLNDHPAVLLVRPRGWHLDEAHVLVDGQPMSASLFDALLYLYHNADFLLRQGTGAYYYLPKMESHLEARLWCDVFQTALQRLKLPTDCVKITVLIETITAAFEMDEIIYELRPFIVGLNCGRWDYIFSFIKKFRNDARCLLPDRQEVTMTSHFLQSYVSLLIKTCHRRGVHAMGGMAAQIPIKGDDLANHDAMARVHADKKREALAGHDGTWVAHPGLIPVALDAFDRIMPGDNQLSQLLSSLHITAADLLEVPEGHITEQGVRLNLTVALQYLASWLSGNGCVPIRNLMEDAATAEICRAQLWQWLRFSAMVNGNTPLTSDLLRTWLDEEYAAIVSPTNEKSMLLARQLLEQLIFSPDFDDFLTLKAYPWLIKERI